jgi:hypothetical protein
LFVYVENTSKLKRETENKEKDFKNSPLRRTTSRALCRVPCSDAVVLGASIADSIAAPLSEQKASE